MPGQWALRGLPCLGPVLINANVVRCVLRRFIIPAGAECNASVTPSTISRMQPPNLPAEYRWLVSEAGRQALEFAAQFPGPVAKLAPLLRKEHTPDQAHLVLDQLQLRGRGGVKFASAGQMYFTGGGLEQATDERIARYKAERFPADQLAVDLCCGIGGDLLALAGRGEVIGVDRDPLTALFASANLAALAAPARGRVLTAEVESYTLPAGAAWHLDPDRRPQQRRTTQLAAFAPGPEYLKARLQENRPGAMKLAPATEFPEELVAMAGTGLEREWITHRRECRQQVLWCGAAARRAGRHAATILTGESEVRTLVGSPDQPLTVAAAVGPFLAEPDPSVLAARLLGALAAEHGLAAVSRQSAYLTGDAATPDAALAWFEVLEVMPMDRRRVKAALRARGMGRLEVKKRAVDLVPAKLQRELRVKGDESGTLLVTRRDQQVIAVIARRVA